MKASLSFIITLLSFSFSVSSSPVVQINQGSIRGVSWNNQDSFLGIPYAQAPIGKLRFAAPAPVVANANANLDATKYGPACLQVLGATTNLYPALTRADVSEDCLSINVVRPSTAEKLPVMVWIYGGSFTTGFSSTPAYNATAFVAESVKMGEPVIYVSLNYRVNSLGFLASSVVADAPDAVLNAGWHDVRLALKWVRDNIGAFGGDPSKVTLFGESAGAIGIGAQLVANNGDHENLFRAVIMESGAPISGPVNPPSHLDSNYENFVNLTGCADSLKNGTSLACLRAVSTDVILNATTTALANPILVAGGMAFNLALDDFYYTRSPSQSLALGKVAQVAVISGNNVDEGTYFTPTYVTSDAIIDQVFELSTVYPGPTVAGLYQKLFQLYPDDPTVGSPYEPVGVSKSDRFYGSNNQYKRYASIYGDLVFESGRRALLSAYLKKSLLYPVFSYQFAQPTPGAAAALGIYHSSEIDFVYRTKYPDASTDEGLVSKVMARTWIAFANNLEPNRIGLPVWPRYGLLNLSLKYKAQDGGLLDFLEYPATLVADNYRSEQMAFLNSAAFNDPLGR